MQNNTPEEELEAFPVNLLPLQIVPRKSVKIRGDVSRKLDPEARFFQPRVCWFGFTIYSLTMVKMFGLD